MRHEWNSDAVKQSSSALCHHANYGTASKVAKVKQGGQIQQHYANIITSASCRHCRQHRNWPGKEKQTYKIHETCTNTWVWREMKRYILTKMQNNISPQNNRNTWNTNTHNNVHCQSNRYWKPVRAPRHRKQTQDTFKRLLSWKTWGKAEIMLQKCFYWKHVLKI